MIGIEVKGDINKDVERLLKKLKQPRQFWGRVGLIMEKSVKLNFRFGGRPKSWKRSQRAIKQSGETLVNTGALRASIRWRRLSANAGVKIGTPLKYGKVHNEGFKGVIAVPAHTRKITQAFGKPLKSPVSVQVKGHSRRVDYPKRKFLVILKQDWKSIVNALHKFLRSK